MFKNIAFSFMFLTSAFLVLSCNQTKLFVRKGHYDTSKVPDNFNPHKHILLVAEMPRVNNPEEPHAAVTKKLDEELKENYPYRYQIVPLKDILDNKKYSDTSVYRFALLNNYSTIVRTTTTTTTRGNDSWSVSPSARTTRVDFNFFDRVSQTNYPSTGNPSAQLKWAIPAFVELLRRKGY